MAGQSQKNKSSTHRKRIEKQKKKIKKSQCTFWKQNMPRERTKGVREGEREREERPSTLNSLVVSLIASTFQMGNCSEGIICRGRGDVDRWIELEAVWMYGRG